MATIRLPVREAPLTNYRRRSLWFPSASTLLGWRLAVALLEVGKNDGADELFFAELVELNANVLLGADGDAAKSKLGVFQVGGPSGLRKTTITLNSLAHERHGYDPTSGGRSS